MEWSLKKFRRQKEVRQVVHSLKRDIEKWKKSILTKMELRKFRTTPIQYMYLCSQDYTGICFRYEEELNIKIFNKVISNLIEKYEFLRSQIIYENGAYWWVEYEMGDYTDVPFRDISNYDEEMQQAIVESCIKNIYFRSYDIFYSLFYRIFILKESEKSFVVIMPFSHTIFDAVSSATLQNDLLNQYQSYLKGDEPQKVRGTRYLEYLDQINKGPVNISDKELTEDFCLEKMYDLSRKVSKKAQYFNDVKKTRIIFSADLNISEEYGKLIDYCMKYAFCLCREILGMNEIPVFVTNIGRMYEMHMYNDIIGAFVDFIPYILTENNDAMGYQKSINELLMKRNVNNINFVKYLLNEKEDRCYSKTAELLSEIYDNYRIIVNYVGFIENNDFEPIIYKYSNNGFVDTLLFTVRIIDGKFTITSEISHYIEEKEIMHIADICNIQVQEISYGK